MLLLFWTPPEVVVEPPEPPEPPVVSGYSTLVTDLFHLEGAEVVVWGMGRDLGTYTVHDGEITILSDIAVTSCVIGRGYEALWKSAKQAFGAAMGTPLTQVKKIDHIGLVMADTHYQGLQHGPSFDYLDSLPLVEDGEVTEAHKVWQSYDKSAVEFSGEWDTDSRLCLKAAAPRPCTVLAVVVSLATNEK